MQTANWQEIEEAKKAALEVLLHNAHGPYHGLHTTDFRVRQAGGILSRIQGI